jgi:hypothetical protein
LDDLATAILNTFHQIDSLKHQLEVSPGDKGLQQQLKELQILQLWRLSQVEHGGEQDAVKLAVEMIEMEKAREKGVPGE